MESFVTVIVWAAIIQGLFLSTLYFFSQKHSSLSNRILALFLLSLIAEACTIFLPIESVAGYSTMDYFGLPEVKLFMPVLFLHYVLLKLGVTSKYRTHLKIGYSLGFAVLMLTPINITLYGLTGDNFREILGAQMLDGLFLSQQFVAWMLSVITFIIAVAETRWSKRKILNWTSDTMLANISWLWQFVLLMAPVILLWGVELTRILIGGAGQSDIVLVNWLILFLVIYYVSFKAFAHRDIFEHAQPIQVPLESQSLENMEELESTVKQINTFMENEQPYLKPDLSLHELAAQSGISARKISLAINQVLSLNFSTWVNTFRVEHAISLINDDSALLSLEGIGTESGFRSRSSMYLAFNKVKGKSPGHFKENPVLKDVS